MTRFTTRTTFSPRPPNTAHKFEPSAHTVAYTQRDTSIDGAQLTLTKGVSRALIIDDAFYHMDHIFADISYYRP